MFYASIAGKYATKQLISNLPQENRPKEVTDETLCAILACLNEVLNCNQDYAKQFLLEGGVQRLLYMSRQQHKYKPRTIKYVAAVRIYLLQYNQATTKLAFNSNETSKDKLSII